MLGNGKMQWFKSLRGVGPVEFDSFQQGCLGPDGPGLVVGLQATPSISLEGNSSFAVRVFQRGQPIASWERGYSDADGFLLLAAPAKSEGGRLTASVWLPYAALPDVIEGHIELHAALYSADNRRISEGRATVSLEPHQDRQANSALGALVEWMLHPSLQFGPLLPEAEAFIRETCVEQFQLNARGEQAVGALIRQAVCTPSPRWKILWNIDRWFERSHHSFLLRNAFEVAEHNGHPVAEVEPYVSEVAAILKIESQGVASAASAAQADVAFRRLKLPAGASQYEVKSAFRRQALKWHPDRWHHASMEKRLQAELKMRQLNQARMTLRRLGYDTGRPAA